MKKDTSIITQGNKGFKGLEKRFLRLTAALPLRVVVSPMDTPYRREG